MKLTGIAKAENTVVSVERVTDVLNGNFSVADLVNHQLIGTFQKVTFPFLCL
jgi:hypothetical protein